jgi:uncharacterized protein with von Willebrand factor type A (vWA) domain
VTTAASGVGKAAPKMIPAVEELRNGRDSTERVPRWDRYVAGSEASQDGAFRAALDKHGKSAAWAAYARETFAKLYDSGLGKELATEDRPDGSDWVSRMHEAAAGLPEWQALRERARRDQWACGVAAGEALNVIAQTVTPPEQDPQQLSDELEVLKDLAAQRGGKVSQRLLRKMGEIQKRLKEAQEAHAAAGRAQAAAGSKIRSVLRGAARRAGEQIAEFDDACATLGAGDGAGLASRVKAPAVEIRTALMKNEKLRRILRRAGRMRAAAVARQRDKARAGQEELCDIRPGRDIARLTPSELANLANPDTEALLYRRLMEDAALTYELRGRERRAEGPIIMMVDESGSMSGAPDEWAKSVAMAMMEIAARQGRPFIYGHFDTSVSRIDRIDRPRDLTLEQLGELATYFHGGGTYIGVALDCAAGLLEKAQSDRADKPFRRADVVLVTDGLSGDHAAQDKAIDRIRALGGHLFSVFIGCDPKEAKEPCSIRADEKVLITGTDITSGDPGKMGAIFSI